MNHEKAIEIMLQTHIDKNIDTIEQHIQSIRSTISLALMSRPDYKVGKILDEGVETYMEALTFVIEETGIFKVTKKESEVAHSKLGLGSGLKHYVKVKVLTLIITKV